MKEVLVGKYVMHDVLLHLYLTEPSGLDGEVERTWGKDGYVRVRIAMDKSWPSVYGALLHELMEYSMILARCGYQPNYGTLATNDSSTRRFMMSHEDFSLAASHAADVMLYASKDLQRIWKAARKLK
jgi:hypothetical protein